MTRRDQCYLVGKRAATLRAEAAVAAWQSLSGQLDDMGRLPQPKFKQLLKAIRQATIDGAQHIKTMEAHQQRVVDEQNALDEKIQKLKNFIGLNPIYRTLDRMEQSRLNRQLDAMTLYSNILGERIAAFKV